MGEKSSLTLPESLRLPGERDFGEPGSDPAEPLILPSRVRNLLTLAVLAPRAGRCDSGGRPPWVTLTKASPHFSASSTSVSMETDACPGREHTSRTPAEAFHSDHPASRFLWRLQLAGKGRHWDRDLPHLPVARPGELHLAQCSAPHSSPCRHGCFGGFSMFFYYLSLMKRERALNPRVTRSSRAFRLHACGWHLNASTAPPPGAHPASPQHLRCGGLAAARGGWPSHPGSCPS